MTAAHLIVGQGGEAQQTLERWRRCLVTLPHVLTAMFLAVCGTLIFRHALWIDEAQAFVIARDSHSVGELLYNMRYEGHPPLWHFLLWILTRFTSSIAVMQGLHLILAAGSVYVVARCSPFPLAAKILFPFGYFPLFEYGVIARNYQLVMLLTFAFCAVWSWWQGREGRAAGRGFLWFGVILALLCFSHAMGVIMAAGLGVMVLMDSVATRAGLARIGQHPVLFILGVVIALGGGVGSAWLLKPPADYGYARITLPSTSPQNGRAGAPGEDADWYMRWDERRFQVALSSLADGIVPMPKQQVHFWDSAMIDSTPMAARFGGALAILGLVLMSRSWRAVLFYIIATGGMLAFNYLKFQGGVRHHGGLFIALLAGLWIAWSATGSAQNVQNRAVHSIPKTLLAVLLAVHVYSASVAVYYAWQLPFATGRAAAVVVREALKPGDLLVADMEFVAPVIAAYVPGHTFHISGTARDGNFILWKKGRPDSRSAGIAQARQYAQLMNTPVIWVTRDWGDAEDVPGATFLGAFDGGGNTLTDAKAIMSMETYAVYRIIP